MKNANGIVPLSVVLLTSVAFPAQARVTLSDLQARVETLEAQVTSLHNELGRPPYQYMTPIGFVSTAAGTLDLRFIDFAFHVDPQSNAFGRRMTAKLLVVDSPALGPLLAAASDPNQRTQLTISLSNGKGNTSIDFANVTVTGVSFVGREFALPSRYTGDPTAPELVEIALQAGQSGETDWSVGMGDGGSTASFSAGTFSGCAVSTAVSYLLNATPSADHIDLYGYSSELGLSSARYLNASAALPELNGAEVCLFGSSVIAAPIDEVVIAQESKAGVKALTLAHAAPLKYRVASTESGTPFFEVTYSYASAVLQYPNGDLLQWPGSIANNR